MFRKVLLSVFAASAAGLTVRSDALRAQSQHDVVALEGGELPTDITFASEGRRPRAKSRAMTTRKSMSMRVLKTMTALALIHTAAAEFCTNELFTDQIACNDGSAPNEHGCCADNESCPSSCGSWGWGFSNGVKICTCNGCAKKRKLDLTQPQQFLFSHNYFRCRHGYNALEWINDMASNAAVVALDNNNRCTLAHSDSYNLPISSGENLAAGQATIEDAVEAWYNEISDYVPGTSGTNYESRFRILFEKLSMAIT